MLNTSLGDDSVFHAEETPVGRPAHGRTKRDPHRLSPEDAAAKPKTSTKAPQKARLSSGGFAACRICHSGEASAPFANSRAGEPLISPCRCTGTMGLYHRGCLERWLSTSETEACEICHFKYIVTKEPEPYLKVLVKDTEESEVERRNLCGDSLCFLCLTPVALTVAFLCYKGGVHYLNAEGNAAASSGSGLFAVAAALVLTWAVWLCVCLSYHCRVYRQWRTRKTLVKLLSTPHRPQTPRPVLASIPEDGAVEAVEMSGASSSRAPLIASPTDSTFAPTATSSPQETFATVDL